MSRSMQSVLRRVGGKGFLCAALAVATLGGCAEPEKPKAQPPKPKYMTLAPKTNLPAFMKGTILEYVDVQNKDPYPVSGYGLVVGLNNTGNNTGVPQSVRNAMIDEMVRHGFGSQVHGLADMQPERILRDPQVSIAEVYALLPPGARAGQQVDAYVQAATGSQTTSLARGELYGASLYVNGVDPLNPRPRVNTFARAKGPVFVNPAYVQSGASRPARLAGLRTGVVMGGGIVGEDRPIVLRARAPQISLTRAIEMRIDQHFQDDTTARTQDEGIVNLFTPLRFGGDWQHFVGLVTHLYMDGTPGTALPRARTLAEAAVQPDAPLMDISYCWEALGPEALSAIQPLYTHTSPEVAFAAARAGVYIGDRAADETMLAMAKSHDHAFQLDAVKVLGSLPSTTRVHRMLFDLLGVPNALVRIEAYRVLVKNESPLVLSRRIKGKFVIDRIPSEGPPLVYATRSSEPRIAVFGTRPVIQTPVAYLAMEAKFMISTAPDGRNILLFDRTDPKNPKGLTSTSRPDVYEVLLRLAGEGEESFRFGYSDLVGILQGLSEGKHMDAPFVLEDIPGMRDEVEDAPPIRE